MSWYGMHRCVYDFVRSDEGDERARREFSVERYDLTAEERAAFDARDIAAFYALDLHRVLLNRYARAVGYSRDDYRSVLQPFAADNERLGRWQR